MDLRENLRMTKRKIRRGKIRVYSAYLIFKYSFWYLFCQKVHIEIKILIFVKFDFENHKLVGEESCLFNIWAALIVKIYQVIYWKCFIRNVWNITNIYSINVLLYNYSTFFRTSRCLLSYESVKNMVSEHSKNFEKSSEFSLTIQTV